ARSDTSAESPEPDFERHSVAIGEWQGLDPRCLRETSPASPARTSSRGGIGASAPRAASTSSGGITAAAEPSSCTPPSRRTRTPDRSACCEPPQAPHHPPPARSQPQAGSWLPRPPPGAIHPGTPRPVPTQHRRDFVMAPPPAALDIAAPALKFPAGTTYEDWLSTGRTLSSAKRHLDWLVGDWLTHGRKHFPEQIELALETLDIEPRHLKRIEKTVEAFPRSEER